jgi:hypothetical protein
MRTDLESTPTTIDTQRPYPGEIWQIQGADTLVMIVHEPIDPSAAPTAVRVMLVSQTIAFLSDIDIWVPQPQSGDSGGLLALTWQVFDMDQADLAQPIGIRLPRAIYDCLLDIGDRHHNLHHPIVDPADFGLIGGTAGSHQTAPIQTFHAQQSAIAQRLTQAFQQAEHEFYAMQAMMQLLDAAAQQVTDLTPSRPSIPSTSSINLSQWLERHISQPVVAGWEQLLESARMPQLIPALRSNPATPNAATIDQWLIQLSASQPAAQRRQAAILLGDRLPANAAQRGRAIAALIELLQTTADDETLWAAVEALWKIDPGNPAAGVRRVKLVDLGMQVAGEPVALAVAIVPQGATMAVLLQVYPSDQAAYLPENLQLILLDESAQVLRQISARSADIYIQLKLSGSPGERFSVRVALGDVGLTEDFVM